MTGLRFGVLIFLAAATLHAQLPVYPGEYLPVYPGSWWTYVTETGDTVRDTTGSEYALEAYGFDFDENLSGLDFVPVYSMSHLSFPWKGSEGPLVKLAAGARSAIFVYRYQIYYPTLQGGGHPSLIRILSPVKWEYWYWSSDIRPYNCRYPDPPATSQNTGCPVRSVVHTDTVVTLNGKTYDSVLVVEYVQYPRTREMYRKGIGLLSMTRFSGLSEAQVIESEKTLLDYHINTTPTKVGQSFHVRTPPASVPVAAYTHANRDPILGFLKKRVTVPVRYDLCHEIVCNWTAGIAGDTLTVAMRMNSGLPPQVDLIEGRLDTLPTAQDSSWWHFRFRIPDQEGQYVRLGLSQAGDSTWYAATPLESFICLPRIPTFRKEMDGSGRALLVSDYTYYNQWMKRQPAWRLGDPPSWREIPGATGREFVPEDTGTYKLASLFDPSSSQSESFGKCLMSPSLSQDSIEIRDLEPNAIAARGSKGSWIRIQGRRIRLDLPQAEGASLTMRIHTLEGRALQGVKVGRHAEGAEVTFASPPKPGLYLMRACAGAVCGSTLAPLP